MGGDDRNPHAKSLPVLWWPYAVGGGLLILLAAGAWYFFRRKAVLQAIPEKPPEPPFDVAIRSLTELKMKNLPDSGRYKEYYSELSEIIRYYIDGRFEIPAIESTTYELKRILKHADLTKDQIKEVLTFLTHADMIKFAKHLPSIDNCDSDYGLVKQFVVATKPIIRVPEQAEVES